MSPTVKKTKNKKGREKRTGGCGVGKMVVVAGGGTHCWEEGFKRAQQSTAVTKGVVSPTRDETEEKKRLTTEIGSQLISPFQLKKK